MPVVSIRNAGVFDGNMIEARDKFTFETSPGNIVDPDYPADIIIEGYGCTVLPGLIDAKIHAGAAPWAFQRFAAAGVTAAIDASSSSADTRAMRGAASRTTGWPSYFASGSAGGCPGRDALTMFPYRSVKPLASPIEAERFVYKRVAGPDRSDFVMVIADLPGLGDQTLLTLVSTAHRHGKIVIAHASSVRGYLRALSTGCDILTPVPIDNILGSDIIDRLCHGNVVIIPTLSFLHRALTRAESLPLMYDTAVANVRALNAAGVPICAGTSANEVEGLAVSFGDGIYQELLLLVHCGLTNTEALQSATSIPAQAYKLSDRGTLAVGKRSDVILLRGNPLDDISAVHRVSGVWIDGVEVDKDKGLQTNGISWWAT